MYELAQRHPLTGVKIGLGSVLDFPAGLYQFLVDLLTRPSFGCQVIVLLSAHERPA